MLSFLANPDRFMAFSRWAAPMFGVLAGLLIAVGLWLGFAAPEDYQQGDTVRMMFIHVPASWLALFVYLCLGVASFLSLVFRHALADAAAKAAAPLGAVFTALALITGSLWGKPMWGTWWVWDARLTSVLVLLLFYLGYIALWSAVEDPDTAADLTSVLCIVGSVFAVLSRYAVNFWNQGLHQGASLSLDKKENVSDVFYLPLLICIAGFILLFVTLVLLRTRTEIRARRLQALLARERLA